MGSCSFKDRDGIKCDRDEVFQGFCQYHLQHGPRKDNKDGFLPKLKSLLEKGDTNWAGFVFPKNCYVSDCEIKHELDLRDARIFGLVLERVVFKENVILDGAIFERNLSIFNGCVFEGDVLIRNVKIQSLKMLSTIFLGKFDISLNSQFSESVLIQDAKFNSKCDFAGAVFESDVNIDAYYNGEAQFAGSNFKARTSFSGKFSGKTTFGGCIFHDVSRGQT